MNLTEKRCPVCSAPLTITPDAGQTRCPYCGTSFIIERSGADVALNLADQMTDAVHQSAFFTRNALRRLQLTQELSTARLRLADVQREMRALKRLPPSGVTKTQLAELQRQEADLRTRVAELDRELNPDAAITAKSSSPTTSRPISWGWLLFSFHGRIRRTLFWIGVAVGAATYIIPLIILGMIPDSPSGADWLAAPASIVMLVGVWMLLAVAIKRLRDRGKSGWWVLAVLIPLIGPLWLLVELGFLKGQ